MSFSNSDLSLIRFNPNSITSHKDKLLSGDIDIKELAEAKKEELKMQIADALSQKKIMLDARKKEVIAARYNSFSAEMLENVKKAIKMYSDGLKEVENAPDELSKRLLIDSLEGELKRKCNFIQDLSVSFLQNIYAEVIHK